MDLGDFFPVLRTHQVDGPFAGDAGDVAPLGHDAHAAAGNHDWIVPPDGVEVEKTLVVDVADEQSQLVHVTGEHQGRIVPVADRGHPIAEGVPGVGVGDALHDPVNDGLGLALEPGGRACVEKIPEKFRRVGGFEFVHFFCLARVFL